MIKRVKTFIYMNNRYVIKNTVVPANCAYNILTVYTFAKYNNKKIFCLNYFRKTNTNLKINIKISIKKKNEYNGTTKLIFF